MYTETRINNINAGLSEIFLVGGCVKKVGGCDELKTKREGGLHPRFLDYFANTICKPPN